MSEFHQHFKYNIHSTLPNPNPNLVQPFHHQSVDDPRVQFFCTPAQCQIAKNKSIVMSDGTHKTTPHIANSARPWGQVWTIHVGQEEERGNVELWEVCTVLLPGFHSCFYELAISWWLSYLEKYDCRLETEDGSLIEDFEPANRKSWMIAMVKHEYKNWKNKGEWFHATKSRWKRIGLFHLKGLYMFNESGNKHFFNAFQFMIQVGFLIDWIPEDVVSEMYIFIQERTIKSMDEIDFSHDSLKTSKEAATKGVESYNEYLIKTWNNGKYSVHECNLYRCSVRVSNATYHNLLRDHCGIHSDLYTFGNGIRKMEGTVTARYLQYMKHGSTHQRRPKYVKREIEIWKIWDKCESDSVKFDKKYIKLGLQYWFDVLCQLKQIMYPDGDVDILQLLD